MLFSEKGTKFCRLCGKDISLEHAKTDENGLLVHESCHAKHKLLKAASVQAELWRKAQSKKAAT